MQDYQEPTPFSKRGNQLHNVSHILLTISIADSVRHFVKGNSKISI